MKKHTYNILLQTDAAEDFFSLLLDVEKRTAFRLHYQNCDTVIATGTYKIIDTTEVKNSVLYIRSSSIPENVTIRYFKSEINSIENYDKILLWEIFPAEDTYTLEKRITHFSEYKIKNMFLEMNLILYGGRIQIGTTDLKTQAQSLKDSEIKCRKKYTDCHVTVIKNEEDFSEKIINILSPSYSYDIKIAATELKNKINDIEQELKYDIEYFEFYLPCNEDGNIISNEHLVEYCSWNNVKKSSNIIHSYFSAFTTSSYYKKLEDILINYYKDKISEICIWDINKDCDLLKKKLKNKLSEINTKTSMSNMIKVPEKEITYNSTFFSELQLKFSKILNNYYLEDAKLIIFTHINQKLSKYRSLIK